MNYCKYVDPFYGNFEPNLPPPNEIASKWFFLKAQVGNTIPGAVVPFGAVSACAYTGGYPTGYGPYLPNSYARPRRFFQGENAPALGFSHFHQSGTGDIGEFYNYSVITPVKGTNHTRFSRFPLSEEKASPDFYSCNMGGVDCAVSVTDESAIYSFDFCGGCENLVVFDPILNGVFRDGENPTSSFGEIIRLEYSENFACSEVEFANGLTLFTALEISQGVEAVFTADKRLEFKINSETAHVKIGFSFADIEKAKENLKRLSPLTLEDVKIQGEKLWNKVLGQIKITASEQYKRKFYSNLYRCFIKPIKISGNNCLGIEGDCYADLATMWDMSKTQLPLLFTLFGEISTEIVNSFLNTYKRYGGFPNCFLLCGSDESSDMQARALTVNAIYDAYLRGIKGVDWNYALECMVGELNRGINKIFFDNKPVSDYPSHTVDLAVAANSVSCLARALGEAEIYEKYKRLSENWLLVYSKRTGMITRSGKFYEGCNLNYSFRLLPDMDKRIALAGGKENFEKALDRFFGFDKKSAKQCLDYRDLVTLKKGEARRGFEGFNNETDMETPYCYVYVGRYDKLCNIVRAGEKYLYGESGRGALCGNEDSGALSSLYIVNSIGLFPVFGQNKIILGSPAMAECEISLSNGKSLRVVAENFSEDRFVYDKITLNGRVLTEPFITVTEMMQGGEMIFS